ncbi:L,D-transpeptidase family protein [Solirubrobacter phytolaccae]|uniref:L,D-transpeptidase family protein n=1 Tax=Solirubrobacter phytolaccae TaxID=1404360 RepID=A0A9X3NBW4_9ACTN|nr:L,D-transpeptidase family protein [Solirubrobacter phytolaccae]MDA0182229.1 L,D-transpeptidase family protein [Solirubrobacter phytolaccae]
MRNRRRLPALHGLIVAATLAFAAPASASTWAHPVNIVAIRAQPDTAAKRVATTRLLTEDKLAEVYLVLQRRDGWVKVRVPGRPNGRTGWVRRTALGPLNTVDTRITVNRKTATLTLTKAGRTVFKTRVGVGKPSTPTPAGHFWVREKLRLTNAPMYGAYALGTSAYAKVSDWPGGGVVGIHGTDQPELIPGRPSHGCVRVRNADMTRLYTFTPVGTPITIV